MREGLSILLILLLLISLIPNLQAQDLQSTFSVKRLSLLEEIVSGEQNTGQAILLRIEDLERKLYGRNMSGSLIERLNRVNDLILLSSHNRPSIFFSISSIEWILWQEVREGSIMDRLLELEELLLGEKGRGNLPARIGELKNQSLPEGRIRISEVEVPSGTKLKTAFLKNLNVQELEVGQLLKYKLVEDLLVDGKMILPAGTKGEAKVLSLNQPDYLGRDGEVLLDFAPLRMMEGREVEVELVDSLSGNGSRKLAASVSVLGIATFGPWGIIAGGFIRGSDRVLKAGEEFYLETSESLNILGIPAMEILEDFERQDLIAPEEE